MNRKLVCGALLCGTCLTSPVFAQSAGSLKPPPARSSIDENGVDLIAREYVASQTQVAIGPDYPHGLSYTRLGPNAAWSSAVATITGSSGAVLVTVDGQSEDFNTIGSSYVSVHGQGGQLVQTGSSTFTYTRRDGTVVQFAGNQGYSYGFYDASLARTSSIRYPDGTKLTFIYKVVQYCEAGNEGGGCQGPLTYAERLQSITNNLGYELKFTYATDSINNRLADTSGEYYNFNNLVSVTAFNLTQDYCDPSADHCSFSQSWPTATYSQSQSSNAVSVTDSLGRVTRYSYYGDSLSAIKRPSSSGDNIVVSYNGPLSAVTIDGRQYSYSWADSSDGTSSTVTVTDPLNHQKVYGLDLTKGVVTSFRDAQGHTTSYTYDDQARLQTVTYPEGGQVNYQHDGRGNVTQTSFVPKGGGNSITTFAAFPSDCSNALTCNEPTSTTDANNNTTSYQYDGASGLVTAVIQPPVNGVSPHIYYGYQALQAYYKDGSGNIVASGAPVYKLTGTSSCRTQASCAGTADEFGISVVYGQAGQANNLLPTSMSKGAGDGSLTATVNMSYDAVGNLLTKTDPMNQPTRYYYDADREVVGVVGPDPDGWGQGNWAPAVRYTYTPDGLVTYIEQGTAPGQSDSDWQSFSSHHQKSIYYDGADRKTSESVLNGGTYYSTTNFSYDGAGRLQCTAIRMNPSSLGTPPGACSLGSQGSFGPDRITVQGYDELDRVTSVTDGYGTGQQRTYVSYSYTPDGKIQTLTDANNNTTTYNYDGFDRLWQTHYPNPSGGGSSGTDYEQLNYDNNGNVTQQRLRDGMTVTYAFDALGRATLRTPSSGLWGSYSYDLTGNLLSANDPNGAIEAFSYDALGRKTSETAAHGGTLSMQYDLAGRRTRLTWADGFFVTYQYDNGGEMTAIWENGANLLINYGYDDDGRRTALCRASNGNMCTQYGYDPASRLSVMNLLPTDGSGTSIGFSYNPANEIVTRTNSNGSFFWNAATNVSRGYAVNGLNQYTNVAGEAQGYDGRGNLTYSHGSSYSYGSRNELTNFPGGYVYYNALGQWLDVNTEQLWMQHDGDQAVEEYGYNGQVLRRYIYGAGGEPLVWYEGSGTGDKRYLEADERGSIIWVRDGSGNSIAVNSYDEYGVPGSANMGRFQYTGQAWIPAINMYYYKARIYSPTLGRFMQTDPIGYADGPNWYNYAHSNPINRTDPSGLEAPGTIEDRIYFNELSSASQVEYMATGYFDGRGNKISKERFDELAAQAGGFMRDNVFVPLRSLAFNLYRLVSDHPVASILGVSLVPGAGEIVAGSMVTTVATETAAAALGGDHVVLGLAAFGLEDTAVQVGGRTLLSDPAWQETLQASLANPSTRFTLSLEGLNGTSVYSQVMGAAQRGVAGSGGYTDWEIGQLYGSGRLGGVGLYRGGSYIPNPFGP